MKRRVSVEWAPRWWSLALKINRCGRHEYLALGLGPWTLLLTWAHGRNVVPRAFRTRRLELRRLRLVMGFDPLCYGVGLCTYWLPYARLDPYNVGLSLDVGPVWGSIGWSTRSVDARTREGVESRASC